MMNTDSMQQLEIMKETELKSKTQILRKSIHSYRS